MIFSTKGDARFVYLCSMRKIAIIFFILSNLISFGQSKSSSDVYLNGYVRKDGTVVPGYYRTAPNSTLNDNFSTKGNTNPYNQKKGWIAPEKQIPSSGTPSSFGSIPTTVKASTSTISSANPLSYSSEPSTSTISSANPLSYSGEPSYFFATRAEFSFTIPLFY